MTPEIKFIKSKDKTYSNRCIVCGKEYNTSDKESELCLQCTLDDMESEFDNKSRG